MSGAPVTRGLHGRLARGGVTGQTSSAIGVEHRVENPGSVCTDADAVLHEVVKLQEHLLAQDEVLQHLLGHTTSPATT